MPPEQASDFERFKDALLKRYQLSADGFKKRFRSAKPEAGKTPSQFLIRLDNYLERWIELAKVTKSSEGLKTSIVQEQYLSTCPKEMAIHLKERQPKTITELGDVAENYVEAHATDTVLDWTQGYQSSVAHSPLPDAAIAGGRPDMSVLSVRGEPQTINQHLHRRPQELHTPSQEPVIYNRRPHKPHLSFKIPVVLGHLHVDRFQGVFCATVRVISPETV